MVEMHKVHNLNFIDKKENVPSKKIRVEMSSTVEVVENKKVKQSHAIGENEKI